MGQVEEEWLARGQGLVEGGQCLACEGFGEERARCLVFFEFRHVKGARAVAAAAQIAARAADGRAGDAYVEAQRVRVGAGGADGGKMGFAAKDGVIAQVAQQLRQRGGRRGEQRVVRRGAVLGADAVAVPRRQQEASSRLVGGCGIVERPVGHAVARRRHARDEAGARG